jgi:hypothetical protein
MYLKKSVLYFVHIALASDSMSGQCEFKKKNDNFKKKNAFKNETGRYGQKEEKGMD